MITSTGSSLPINLLCAGPWEYSAGCSAPIASIEPLSKRTLSTSPTTCLSLSNSVHFPAERLSLWRPPIDAVESSRHVDKPFGGRRIALAGGEPRGPIDRGAAGSGEHRGAHPVIAAHAVRSRGKIAAVTRWTVVSSRPRNI